MKAKRVMQISCVLVSAMVIREAFSCDLHVQEESIYSPKIDQALRIVFISDLHNNLYGEKQAKLKAKIAGTRPDIVLLGGDFFDVIGDNHSSCQLLEWLGAHYDTYYVTGNHEFYTKKVKAWKQLIHAMNIQVLAGDTVSIPNGHNTIQLSGLDDARNRREFKKQVHKINQQINPEDYAILLSHRPDFLVSHQDNHFDLILTGHTHGGQFRLPGVINGLYAPGQGLFPKYAGGLYELENGQKLIVNRGLMTQYQKFPRIFNRPEVWVIDILPQK